jgi:histidinol-phosphate/aromatic aminotransferase/cobyric acid decarboxylase-like protein
VTHSQVAACAALTNIPYIERVRDALLSERARLFEQLQAVSWLEPYPSQANFILCKVLEVGTAFQFSLIDHSVGESTKTFAVNYRAMQGGGCHK